jgi:basic membrane protein A
MFSKWMSALAVAAAAFVAGCGDSSTAPPATGPGGGGGGGGGTAGGPVQVGLLLTGSTSDGGWNQLAADSLTALATAAPISTTVRQQVSKDAAADAIRQFDARGFAVVIAHGYEYLDVAKELADPSKPGAVKVKIAVSGGDADSPHFQSLFYDLAPASYQLGVLAGKVTRSGKLAFVGGAPFPTVTAMKRGFEAGARSVNPAVTVAEQYTGWDDPSKAKQQTEAFIQQGCDVIMQNVDAASSGVFEAVKEANGRLGEGVRVYTFGANSDQNANATASAYILASAVIKMDAAFGAVIKQVQAGTFKGGLVKEDLASGVAVAVLNPKLVGTVITPDLQKAVDDAGKKLADGSVKIPAQ